MNNKNETIKATLKATKAKRKHQTCKVYQVKIDRSHLNYTTNENLNRMFPSTKTCSKCKYTREIALDERVYVCKNCGNVIDRDFNSSINIEDEGLKQIGMVRTELTPVEIEANTLRFLRYFNSNTSKQARSMNRKPYSFSVR